jgi:hypothetical protein
MGMQGRVVAELAAGEAGVPDAGEYERLRPFLLEAHPAEALYVRRLALANDAYDRADERFPPAILERLAETLVGKPLLIGHDKSGLPSGLFYRAHTRPAAAGEAGTLTLEAWFYLVRTPANAEVRAQIDAGVARYCSIGFLWDQRTCDVCGSDYWGECPHYRGQRLEDGRRVTLTYGGEVERYEAVEGSLVYLGCQRLAQLIKQAYFEEEEMEGDKLAARLAALEEQVGRLAGDADRRSVFGVRRSECDVSATADSELTSSELGALVADGKAYRVWLRGEAARLAGLVGGGAEAELLLTALPNAGAAQLRTLVEGYQKRLDERFPPAGLGSLTAADPGIVREPEGAPGGRRLLRLS